MRELFNLNKGLRPLLWAGAVTAGLGMLASPASAQVTVYSNNFDGPTPTAGFQSISKSGLGPGSFEGSVESVGLFGGGVGVGFGPGGTNVAVNAIGGPVSGTFGGNYLRNATTDTPGDISFQPHRPTTLKVDGLGSHSTVGFKFLLAILDTWDGESLLDGQDKFRIRIGDGVDANGNLINGRTILDRFVGSTGGNQKGPVFGGPDYYDADPNSPGANFLTWRRASNGIDYGYGLNTQNSNFGNWNLAAGGSGDDAFDMGTLNDLQNVAHTASTLAVSFEGWSPAGGSGIQGRSDESWAIDNLTITYDGQALGVPEPASLALFLPGAVGLVGVFRKRRKA